MLITRSLTRSLRRRSSAFPFLKLPVELRLQIYGYLLHATGTRCVKRALPKLRPYVSQALGDGRIVIRKTKGTSSELHSRSARPSLTFLRTCQQIRAEAVEKIYKLNSFELVACTQRRAGQLIFGIPGFLRLDWVRELALVTHNEVSQFQSCFAYDWFSQLKNLRKVSIAMKTTKMG